MLGSGGMGGSAELLGDVEGWVMLAGWWADGWAVAGGSLGGVGPLGGEWAGWLEVPACGVEWGVLSPGR